jgi:hypothetical protein
MKTTETHHACSVTAPNENARVVELLITAAEYANFAMDRLIRQLDGDHAQLRKLFYDYVGLVHTLEVTFLFPEPDSRASAIFWWA